MKLLITGLFAGIMMTNVAHARVQQIGCATAVVTIGAAGPGHCISATLDAGTLYACGGGIGYILGPPCYSISIDYREAGSYPANSPEAQLLRLESMRPTGLNVQ